MELESESENKKMNSQQMKVYVAGSSKDLARASAFIERVREHPRMKITHDWPARIAAHVMKDPAVVNQWNMLPVDRVACSIEDLRAVERANTIVVLPSAGDVPLSRGLWFEAGYALALNVSEFNDGKKPDRRIIFSGGNKRSIFGSLVAEVNDEATEAETDARTFAIISEWADMLFGSAP